MELTQFSEFWKNYAFTFNAEQVKTAEYEKKIKPPILQINQNCRLLTKKLSMILWLYEKRQNVSLKKVLA